MAENKLQSLTEIFNEKFFRIPDFQRGFSWGKNQLEDFWEDILNLKKDKIHYTGLLTVEQVYKKDIEKIETWDDDIWLFERDIKAYYLIDGQQRLTTSIILINEIINKFKEDDDIIFKSVEHWKSKFLYQTYKDSYKSFIFGYEKDNPSDEYFKTKILNQESSTSDKVPEKTLYTANLAFAKKYFKNILDELEHKEIEQIFKKLTSRFKFNFYEIDSELDVYVTFETMNNRGKPLSNLELLKNRLIYLSTMLDNDDKIKKGLRRDINETWKTIYEYLGKNKDNPLDDDDFLRNHWIMFFKYDRKESGSYAKFLLNKKFTAKKIIKGQIQFDDIKDYINSLSKSVKSWFYLYNVHLSEYSNETKEWIQKLNRLGMSAFPPLFMAALTKLEEEDFLPLLKSAEQFIFLVFRLSQRPSNTKNSHFYRLANEFYFNKKGRDIHSVIGNIDWMTQGESEEDDEYIYHGWFNLEKFKNYINDKYQKGEGFYSWNGLRYFLFEYELSLQEKAKGNSHIEWKDFNKRKKEDTIEHVYPQTPKEKYWKVGYEGLNKKQQRNLMHSIGNLVLLAKSKNSELQNKDFEFKKKHTNKDGDEVGFFNGSYSEIEVSSYDNWHPNEIMKRGMKLLEFMEERWGFNFSEWEIEKAELLKVIFLKEEISKE